jgi:cobalamin biosynthesis protein CobT
MARITLTAMAELKRAIAAASPKKRRALEAKLTTMRHAFDEQSRTRVSEMAARRATPDDDPEPDDDDDDDDDEAKKSAKHDDDGDHDDVGNDPDGPEDEEKAKRARAKKAKKAPAANLDDWARDVARLKRGIRRVERANEATSGKFSLATVAEYREAHPHASVAEACNALSISALAGRR